MDESFDHKALHIAPKNAVVFTALSKKLFYMRFLITKFVLEQSKVPINPFTSFDYFMLDTIDRDEVRSANNTLVERSDELWVFGEISDGVKAEIVQCEKAGKPIRYFVVKNDKDISEINKNQAKVEK